MLLLCWRPGACRQRLAAPTPPAGGGARCGWCARRARRRAGRRRAAAAGRPHAHYVAAPRGGAGSMQATPFIMTPTGRGGAVPRASVRMTATAARLLARPPHRGPSRPFPRSASRRSKSPSPPPALASHQSPRLRRRLVAPPAAPPAAQGQGLPKMTHLRPRAVVAG